MTRDRAVAATQRQWDEGRFLGELVRLVAIRSESQEPESRPELYRYLREGVGPMFAAMGYRTQYFENSVPTGGPFLVADRIEDPGLPTVLTYGHGDVVRGLAEQWRKGLDPWTLTIEGERVYGRGTVDNKGQHLIAMRALDEVARARGGKLGFNSKFIVETGEEIGSGGLRQFLDDQGALLAADVFIALDGPRQTLTRPEIKLGGRGGVSFDLVVRLREAQHHSGHWGGLLRDPGFILGHALSRIVSAKGKILVPGWTPARIPNSVRAACATIEFEDLPGLPEIDPDWGEPGLSKAEKIFAWTSVIVLAHTSGTPERPVNAVQGEASARLQVRHTVDVAANVLVPALRRHLDAEGFKEATIVPVPERENFPASRTDPDDPWVKFAIASLTRTTGRPPNVIVNSSGSNPSLMFVEALGTPTIWIPNSYAGCGQHGPDEHGLAPLYREGLAIMAGLYWDIGAGEAPERKPLKLA
ncbi:MAG: M20/M25/M40 family metallo-hydrolase [Alphaproteobacteria bacterium]|nr:M20/M25/M40 family metallo-hydrolase [Alphaproteobacteria bacterium]